MNTGRLARLFRTHINMYLNKLNYLLSEKCTTVSNVLLQKLSTKRGFDFWCHPVCREFSSILRKCSKIWFNRIFEYFFKKKCWRFQAIFQHFLKENLKFQGIFIEHFYMVGFLRRWEFSRIFFSPFSGNKAEIEPTVQICSR